MEGRTSSTDIKHHVRKISFWKIEDILTRAWVEAACIFSKLSLHHSLEEVKGGVEGSDVIRELRQQDKAPEMVWSLLQIHFVRQGVATKCQHQGEESSLPTTLLVQTELALAGLLQSLLYVYGDHGPPANWTRNGNPPIISEESSLEKGILEEEGRSVLEITENVAKADKSVKETLCGINNEKIEILGEERKKIVILNEEENVNKEIDKHQNVENEAESTIFSRKQKATIQSLSPSCLLLKPVLINHKDACTKNKEPKQDTPEEMYYEEYSLFGLSLDIVDWAIRQLMDIVTLQEESCDFFGFKDGCDTKSQLAKAQLQITLRAVGVVHSVCCSLKVHSLSVARLLVQERDTPMLVSKLLRNSPWRNGAQWRFEKDEWVEADESSAPLTMTECQLWTVLMVLLLDKNDVSYEIGSSRKESLLNLRHLITPKVLDQVPQLEVLSRWLATLPIMDYRPAGNAPLITTVTQMEDKPLGNWKLDELMNLLKPRLFQPSQDTLVFIAQHMSGAFDLTVMQTILDHQEDREDPGGVEDVNKRREWQELYSKCGSCGRKAEKKCSGCKVQRYCKRSCQVHHWQSHRLDCDYLLKKGLEISRGDRNRDNRDKGPRLEQLE